MNKRAKGAAQLIFDRLYIDYDPKMVDVVAGIIDDAIILALHDQEVSEIEKESHS